MTLPPTGVPPEMQEDGALGWGPKTLKLIDPVGEKPPEKAPETEDPAIGLPVVPAAGALSEREGLAGGVPVAREKISAAPPRSKPRSPINAVVASEESATALPNPSRGEPESLRSVAAGVELELQEFSEEL